MSQNDDTVYRIIRCPHRVSTIAGSGFFTAAPEADSPVNWQYSLPVSDPAKFFTGLGDARPEPECDEPVSVEVLR